MTMHEPETLAAMPGPVAVTAPARRGAQRRLGGRRASRAWRIREDSAHLRDFNGPARIPATASASALSESPPERSEAPAVPLPTEPSEP